MKKLVKFPDYISVFKYLCIFFIFVVFNNIEKEILPYSSAVLIAFICQGSGAIILSLLYLLSFFVCGAFGLLASQAIFALFFIIVSFIYKKSGAKIKYECLAYCIVALLGFILLGDTINTIPLTKRIITSLIIVALSLISYVVVRAFEEKGLKVKYSFDEFFSLIVFTAFFGTGICNFVSPYLWRTISVVIILLVCYLCKTGISTLVSAILGIGISLYYGDVSYLSIFVIYSVAGSVLTPFSRYVAGISIVFLDYILELIFGLYGGYSVIEFLSVLSGCVVFSLIPTKALFNFKEKLYSFRERQLIRQTINTNRLTLSGRLYDLSGVFTEMANAFESFKKNGIDQTKAKSIMVKQIQTTVCDECEYKAKCKKKDKEFKLGLEKITDIGFAKGKLSLIDVPKEISDCCLRPNNILFGLNKLLSQFRSYALERANLNTGRDIIASQAVGVAEILRGLAIDSGSTLKFYNRMERKLCENLYKSGFISSELLIYGDGERLSVGLITTMKEINVKAIENIIKKTLGADVELCDKTQICEDKCYLLFKRSTQFDAVYGLSRVTKDGSSTCGDTYSVMRITDDRLLVALSDGMGSGEQAEDISSTSLSLIESFYKAGLSSPLILNTVNKLLSVNTEDNFTALDVSIIDLKTCNADFIKYGAPYGFIIGEQGIKIVEGNSLPLGIIDELKPTVCSTTLNDGDILLLLTDGISDAFSSSGAIIDFLRLQTAKNPQTLADSILSKAVELNGGLKKDDMSALAVRIFKRTSA